jgi:glycosyltransferase involved in cell wall biosynthesis
MSTGPAPSRPHRSEEAAHTALTERAGVVVLHPSADRLRPLTRWQPGAYPTVTAVVPARNEALNLPHVLPLLDQLVDEIVLVDGRSTDETVAVAQLLVADVRIVHQTGNGKGDALRAGFAVATGDIVVTVDADGSTCPTEIPAFVGLLLAGADYVKGSRFLHGGGSEDISTFRRIGNSFLVTLARLMHGGRYSDLCYGYNAFWRRCLDDLCLTGDGFEIETIMNVRALRAGLDVREVPSFERVRRHGESNLRAVSDGTRVLKALFRELWVPRARPRFRRPWRPSAAQPRGYLPPFAFRAVATGGAIGDELIVENRPEL